MIKQPHQVESRPKPSILQRLIALVFGVALLAPSSYSLLRHLANLARGKNPLPMFVMGCAALAKAG